MCRLKLETRTRQSPRPALNRTLRTRRSALPGSRRLRAGRRHTTHRPKVSLLVFYAALWSRSLCHLCLQHACYSLQSKQQLAGVPCADAPVSAAAPSTALRLALSLSLGAVPTLDTLHTTPQRCYCCSSGDQLQE